MGWDAQEPLTRSDENCYLRDRVGGEIVKLHLVLEAQHLDGAPRRHAEPALVEAGKADDMAPWGFGSGSDPDEIQIDLSTSTFAGKSPFPMSPSK